MTLTGVAASQAITKLMRTSTQTKLIGTRCRFQRISDSKVFGGWLDDFHNMNVMVRGEFGGALRVGDRVLFTLSSGHAGAAFFGQFPTVPHPPQDRRRAFQARPPQKGRAV